MSVNMAHQSASTTWQDISARKRAERDAAIAAWTNTPQPVESVDVASIDDVQQLLQLIETRQISAQAVTAAYINKACDAQKQTNCLTEICFDSAMSQARILDDFQSTHSRLIGPLHGIPVSLKDQFNVAGVDSTLGYVGRAFAPARENALLVKTLRMLGAVVIAKTNLPQSIMWCETENPIWGLTTHPLDSRLTPGGSSGGEAALLSLCGSLVGWGTDIGGSIRIPSHMNGLWGLKPSSNRLSYHGVPVSTEGQQHVPSAIGPMARSLTSLVSVTQAVIETKPWMEDPQCVPLPWRADIFNEYRTKKQLSIAVLFDDGVVKVHPPIERILRDIVAILEKAGHEIVAWDATLHKDCVDIMDAYYTADGGEDIRTAVTAGGEPFLPHVEALINRGKPISVYKYWELNRRKVAVQKAYSDKWNAARTKSGRPVDVLFMPTMPHPALLHRGCRWVGYTKVWNVLDYPALSFPAGKVSKELDAQNGDVRDYVPRNEADEWNLKQYDVELMDGLPVGLQIVGRRYEEEKVLGVAMQVEALLNA